MDGIRSLVGRVYPVQEPVPGVPGRQRRLWIVRTEQELPDAPTTAALVERIWQKLSLELPVEAAATASVTAMRIDACHFGLEVVTPHSGLQVGDEALVATWGVIGEVDLLWRISELQGIPREHWFMLSQSGSMQRR